MRGSAFISVGALLMLVACGNPLDRVERLSDVPLEEENTQREIVADTDDTPPQGLLATLFGRGRNAPETAVSETARESDEAVTAATPVPVASPDEAAAIDETTPTQTPVNPAEPVAETAPARGGFLGLFRRKPASVAPEPTSDTADAAPLTVASETDATGQAEADTGPLPGPAEAGRATAAADPAGSAPDDETQEVQVAAAGATGGLFGFLRRGASPGNPATPKPGAKRTGPDARDISEGEQVAFGEIARLCKARASALGKEVARYPERGAKYRIYDSFPDSTAPRPFYISGFRDGCLRQFTGALVIFGSPVMHEQLRYGLPAKVQPYSNTDKGYETVKTKVCSVSTKKPCGSRMSRLEKDTVFISYYERFGGASRWGNILLHGGEVIAADVKSK